MKSYVIFMFSIEIIIHVNHNSISSDQKMNYLFNKYKLNTLKDIKKEKIIYIIDA